MSEEITNATEMAEGEEIRSATKKRFFEVSFKLKVLSQPFLINIAFALEFYSPSFSIRSFLAPETYCNRGKHSRKYGIYQWKACKISFIREQKQVHE